MSTQPNALVLADALEAWDGVLMMPIGWRQQTSEELRAQHELIQKLKSILGGVLKCERDSDGRIVLNGWQESVISKQLAAAEAHK